MARKLGKDEFIGNCIAAGRVEPLITLTTKEVIVLSPKQVSQLIDACLIGNGQPGKAELVLKNFPHTSADAELVISVLLGLAEDVEASRRMLWERACDIAFAEKPPVALEKLLEYAIAQGYHDKIDFLLEQMGRKIKSSERSALFASLLSKDKLPEIFEMANALSKADKKKLIEHCARKGLVEDWLKAIELARVAPEDVNWQALWAGIKAKAEHIEEIVERSDH